MKVLLTGITGNLGYSLGLSLISRGITVVPQLRAPHEAFLESYPGELEPPFYANLLQGASETLPEDIDAVVHAAGDVRFQSTEHANERMMSTVIEYASKSNSHIPIHYVGTAYTYRPEGFEDSHVNEYERDKARTENLLVRSNIPYSIYRPSVLTGRTDTGELRSYNGYYRIVRAFVEALEEGRRRGRTVRFPRMLGTSNVVPVDIVSEYIADSVLRSTPEDLYLTNPNPPSADLLLKETLEILGLSNCMEIVDTSFEEFGALELTVEERALYTFATHVRPYWSSTYDFPSSVFSENYISRQYLEKTLDAFTHHHA